MIIRCLSGSILINLFVSATISDVSTSVWVWLLPLVCSMAKLRSRSRCRSLSMAILCAMRQTKARGWSLRSIVSRCCHTLAKTSCVISSARWQSEIMLRASLKTVSLCLSTNDIYSVSVTKLFPVFVSSTYRTCNFEFCNILNTNIQKKIGVYIIAYARNTYL